MYRLKHAKLVTLWSSTVEVLKNLKKSMRKPTHMLTAGIFDTTVVPFARQAISILVAILALLMIFRMMMLPLVPVALAVFMIYDHEIECQ